MLYHDNAYSDIITAEEGRFFPGLYGAKDVGVNFLTFKSYNLTGAKSLSWSAIGDCSKFKTVRSQIDYGVFKPVQYGAIAALNGPQDAVIEQCAEYERRNHALCGGLRRIGWNVPDGGGTMFLGRRFRTAMYPLNNFAWIWRKKPAFSGRQEAASESGKRMFVLHWCGMFRRWEKSYKLLMKWYFKII
ncbi:MAG: hypothetical protein ACLSFZ_11290 [Frisingicoccus sp.]